MFIFKIKYMQMLNNKKMVEYQFIDANVNREVTLKTTKFEYNWSDDDFKPIFKENRGSQGYDLKITSIIKIFMDNQTILVGTGVKLNMPPGIYTHLYLRSSIAGTDYLLANGVGIIDNNYQGEIKAALVDLNKLVNGVDLLIGKVFLQLVFFNTVSIVPKQVSTFDMITERGEGGFGSTNEKK